MSEKVSIAMAVYQGEKYLGTQLDSILKQLGPDDEIIASYDKSKDSTLSLLEEYARKDSRLIIVYNDKPGVTGNFNNAITHCTGDYIYISDQDDRWADNKVLKVQRCFQETHADLVIHNGIHTDENLNPIGKPFFEMYRIGDGKIRNIIKPRYSGCCMAFTKKMKEIILPMPEIRGYDQWIATVCEFFGKIAYLDDILIEHRLHTDNVTPTKRRPLKIVLMMRARLIAFLIGRGIREKRIRNGHISHSNNL